MGVHVEWSTATDCGVEVVLPGVGVGNEGEVDTGNYGLVLGSDTLFVVEGTADELREFAYKVHTAVQLLPPAPKIVDLRASELDTRGATHVKEYGFDEWLTIKKLKQHGDTVLVTGADGEKASLDIDTVVQALVKDPTRDAA